MAAPESTALITQSTMTAVLKLPTASISNPERVQQNIYWDCYNGIRSALQPKDVDSLADTFEEVEKLYYKLHYTNFTEKQNERNAKIRHTERNRSPEDLLTSKKTCPEESIYQLGTLESHASPKELFQNRHRIYG